MTDCNSNCSSCEQECESRTQPQQAAPQDFMFHQNEMSNIKKVIGIVSGKGGVGKSLVTSAMAVEMRRRGYKVGIMDCDITGPSIPLSFGLHTRAAVNEAGILPVTTKTGIEVMSINLLLEDETKPVVWRGPVLGGVIKQFWEDVSWGELDYMFVDMPPGTGDVPLTVFQSLPVDGIIVVTSPQELVSMIVSKAVEMAKMMSVPILGLVENMSYALCPHCGESFSLFGESHIGEVAAKYNLKLLDRLPIDPRIANGADTGTIELIDNDLLKLSADVVEALNG